jgi:hemolysin activation/secretion protein
MSLIGMRLSVAAILLLTSSLGSAADPGADASRPGFTLPAATNPSAAAELGDAAPVHVERIAFRGNRVLRVAALQAVAAPYLGRDLSAAEIEELRIALTHQYTDRGFINSGVVQDPGAPYRDGTLSFLAIEGHFKEIRVHGLAGLHPSYVIDRLRASDDEVLNVNVLRERYQRLLDDPLFARLNSRIEPGAELGEAVIDVDAQRARPYSLALALNNYRPPSIGEKAYDLSGQVRDITGLGDVIDADLTGPLDFSGGVGCSLGWQLPVNRAGSLLGVSASRTDTVITEEPLAALDVRSTVERQELKLTQPFLNSVSQRFNLGVSIAHEQNWTTLGSEAFSFLPGSSAGVTRAVTVRLIPDYSYRSEVQYFGARLTVLHATLLDYPSGPVAYALPDPRYIVWTGQLHHVWDLPQAPFELESRATVQRTNSRISDLHALEIGGINSVRGFRENEILASNVDNLNVDFRWLALRAHAAARPALTVGTFFDWAEGHDVGERTDTFSSTGITLRLKWPHVQADLALAAPLIHPAFTSQEHGSWQDHGIHVQVAATL